MREKYNVPESLVKYLYSLKINDRNDVYETLLLMMLNEDFRKIIEHIIDQNIKNVKLKNGGLKLKFFIPKDYKEVVQLVCRSKFFIKNFTKIEIEKKKTIAVNLVNELILQVILSHFTDWKNQVSITLPSANNPSFGYKDNNASALHVIDHSVVFPLIKHEIIKDKEGERVQITFNKDEQLDDLVKYLKSVLGIKNSPRKKKLSLGQSFRILQIEKEVKNKWVKYKRERREYPEQIVAKEMFKKYKKRMSFEAISRALQRIKRIERQINTFDDK